MWEARYHMWTYRKRIIRFENNLWDKSYLRETRCSTGRVPALQVGEHSMIRNLQNNFGNYLELLTVSTKPTWNTCSWLFNCSRSLANLTVAER